MKNQRVGVYIVQEHHDNTMRRFRVTVHDKEKLEFLMCKSGNTSWEILTHDLAQQIQQDLLSHIAPLIEKRLKDERKYISPN